MNNLMEKIKASKSLNDALDYILDTQEELSMLSEKLYQLTVNLNQAIEDIAEVDCLIRGEVIKNGEN